MMEGIPCSAYLDKSDRKLVVIITQDDRVTHRIVVLALNNEGILMRYIGNTPQVPTSIEELLFNTASGEQYLHIERLTNTELIEAITCI